MAKLQTVLWNSRGKQVYLLIYGLKVNNLLLMPVAVSFLAPCCVLRQMIQPTAKKSIKTDIVTCC